MRASRFSEAQVSGICVRLSGRLCRELAHPPELTYGNRVVPELIVRVARPSMHGGGQGPRCLKYFRYVDR
jgi:hypothetical protein